MFPAPTLTRSQLNGVVPLVSETLPDFRSVVVGIWVRVGSHFESPSVSGISHLVEHLLFKGTLSRSGEQISQEIDFLGGDLDAFTEREYTCYYLRVLPEHLATGLELLCDVVLHPAFDPQELEREKQVVLQEILQAQDSPADAVADLLSEVMFPDQPFGSPILGNSAVISSLDRDVVLDFYRQAYRPERIFVAASGSFDQDLMLQELQRHFSDVASSDPSSPPSATPFLAPPPLYEAGRWAQSMDTQQTHLCLGLPAVTQHDDDRYALSLVDAALGGGVSSRLFQEIREKRGLAYSVSSFMSALEQVGIFGVQVATTLEHLDDLVGVIQAELSSLRLDGLTRAELEKAKNQARGSLLMGLETPGARMMAIGRSLLHFDRVVSVEEMLQRLDAVSQEDTVRVSQRVFDDDRQAWALVGPLESTATKPRFLERGFRLCAA